MKKKIIYSEKVEGKKYFLAKISDKNSRKKYFFGKNLDYFQIVWKIFIYSDKVSGKNFYPDKLFYKFPGKIQEKNGF